MLILGRVVAPFGVDGWLRIHPFGDDPLSWRKISNWWLAASENAGEDAWQPFKLKACRMHGKSLIAALEGIGDRSAAEKLGGMFVGAQREAMPEPAAGEYYWGDLVGLRVSNAAGEDLGTVSGLMETGVHHVLQVRQGDTERLIPFVAAYVGEIDVAGGSIKVDWGADW